MDSRIFMKSETKSSLNPAPFWTKATLTLISCDSFLLSVALSCPRLENNIAFSITALTENRKYQKMQLKSSSHETPKPQRSIRN